MAEVKAEAVVSTSAEPEGRATRAQERDGAGQELALAGGAGGASSSTAPGSGGFAAEGSSGALHSDAFALGTSTPTPAPTPTLTPTPASPLVYPKPLATQEAVLADEQLFMQTFYTFHTSMRSRPAIPKMGGRDLDVHLLYREVSSRGGLQQVIRDRKWKEITLVFKLPRTTTSASYVLRRYYVNLLFHYEQVYRNGVTGPLLSPPANLSSASPSVRAVTDPASEPVIKRRRNRKRKLAATELPAVDPAEFLGTTVVGNIDGKVDFGYLVTMVIGGEKLKGVLYHMLPHGQLGPQYANLPALFKMSTELSIPGVAEKQKRRKRRRKDEMPKKDPNAPRPNRTGYNFFFAEQRQRLKLLHPDKDREISRMIGEAWNALTEEEKMPYQERGVEDKERFKKEIRDYREKLRSGFFDKPANGEGAAEVTAGASSTNPSSQAAAVSADLSLVPATADVDSPPAASFGVEGYANAVIFTQ